MNYNFLILSAAKVQKKCVAPKFFHLFFPLFHFFCNFARDKKGGRWWVLGVGGLQTFAKILYTNTQHLSPNTQR